MKKKYKIDIEKIICQLDEKNNNLLKLINTNVRDALKIFEEITYTLSNVNYENIHNYYSKLISKEQFKRNQQYIKSFIYCYNQSTKIVVNKIKNNNISIHNKFLIYLVENYKKINSDSNDEFYSKFHIVFFNGIKKTTISFSNIYSFLDSEYNYKKRRKMYYGFINKIKNNELIFKENIESIIKNNLKQKEYLLNICNYNNINLNVFKKLEKTIKNSKILLKYFLLKKEYFNKKSILPIELFSSPYKYKFDFNLEDVEKAFAIYGKEYYSTILSKINNDVFIDKLALHMGVNISDMYGNCMIIVNKSNKLEDMFIVAHELGHCLYNNYTENKIIISKDILSSEICAIFNEILLNEYFVNSQKINDFYFLDSIMKIIIDGTLGSNLLKKIYIDGNINYDSLKNQYITLLRKIYENNLLLSYSEFDFIINNYVYNDIYILRYTLALIIAINIYHNIQNDFNYMERYKEFIHKSSTIVKNKELFELLNIDLNDNSTYLNVINYIEKLMEVKSEKNII